MLYYYNDCKCVPGTVGSEIPELTQSMTELLHASKKAARQVQFKEEIES